MSLAALKTALDALDEPACCEGTYAPYLLPDLPMDRWVIRTKAAATLIHEACSISTGSSATADSTHTSTRSPRSKYRADFAPTSR